MSEVISSFRTDVSGCVLKNTRRRLFLWIALLLPLAGLQAQTFSPIPTLYFTKTFASLIDPLPQNITVTSTGTNLVYTASASTSNGGNWLSFSGLYSYNTTGTTPTVVTIASNSIVSLGPGNYTGQVVFTTGKQSLTVQVVLTIVAPAASYFSNLPGQMSFSLKTGGSTPPSQTIQIRNAISGLLTWTVSASTADGGAWLVPSATSGTTPSLVTFSLATPNLPGGGGIAGNFIGQLLFQSATGNVTIPVSVVVGDSVFQQINPISFTKIYGGTDPLPQVLTIASTNAKFNFSGVVNTALGGSWLSISGLSSYDTEGTTPQVVFANISTSPTLPVGSYTGQIVLNATSMAVTIPVTLTVANASDQVFDNMPGQLGFAIMTNATSTPAESVDVRNAGAGTLSWTLKASTADSGNWLSVSSVGGIAPSGPISVSVSVPNLPYGGLIAGTFTGQLLFQSATNSVTVPICVTVGANVFDPVTPLLFTKIQGGANPLAQTLTIPSTGSNFNFTAAAYTANGGSWLSITGLYSYDTEGTTPQVFSVVVNDTSNLPNGTYTGQVVLTTGSMAMTIPVTLVVGGPAVGPLFDNLPGQMSFFIKTSSGSPSSQSIQIRNAGSGTLNWTLSAITSDGGNWLSVDSTAGVAPSQVTVSVSAANLPYGGLAAGTFTGMLTLRSATGGGISIPVSAVVGASVFVQPGPLTFSKVKGGSNPAPQVVTISSTGTNIVFTAFAASANGGNWLSVTGLNSYDTEGTTPQVISAVINADPSLATGTYTGEIVAYTSSMALTIPVTLVVGGTQVPALGFVPITPCRVIDTRNPTGAFGGPSIAGQTTRNVTIPSSACSIPANAQAYSLNVTVVPQAPLGFLTVWPTGQTQPTTSTLNSDGRVKANAAIVPAGTGGAVSFYASNTTDLIVDINGYFLPASTSTLAYYPITPCRIADTRNATGNFGGPYLSGQATRTIPVRSSSCGVGASAQAYSLNLTAVPHAPLGYLTMWPAGQTQPNTSSLNAGTGVVTANAAIVPAGTSGSLNVYASSDTDLVVDIDGYFAAPGTGGLSLYNLTPCRVLDSRFPAGSLATNGNLAVNVTGSNCSAPATAQAFVLNATVVPAGPLGYLSLWAQGNAQPVVSTLNAVDGAVSGNLALVPTANGSISAFTSSSSFLILDLSGYFAP